MAKKDKLFSLIKSMSMAEKRYFKINASKHMIHGENNYVVLFDAMDSQEVYDQSELIQTLTHKEIATRHLAADKSYLYKLLLKDLSAFNSGKTVSLKVKELLIQVEVLFDKGLYDQCLSLLKKAKHKAAQYDLYPLLIEISLIERKIMVLLEKLPQVQESLDEALGALAKTDNLHAFLRLYYQMVELHEQVPRAFLPEQTARYEEMIAHPFLDSPENPLSLQATIYYWRIYALYYQGLGNNQLELETLTKIMALMENHHFYQAEFPEDYLAHLLRLIELQIATNDEQFKHLMDKLKDIPKVVKKGKREIALRVKLEDLRIRVSREMVLGKPQSAWEKIGALESYLESHSDFMTQALQINYYYLITCLYIIKGQAAMGLPFVNRLLQDFPQSGKYRLRMEAEVLNLIIHYQLGNYDLIRYNVHAVNRYLKKHERQFSLFTDLLEFFLELIKRSKKPSNQTLSLYLSGYLKKFIADSGQQKWPVIQYFDIENWLRSLQQDKTYLYTLQQQFVD